MLSMTNTSRKIGCSSNINETTHPARDNTINDSSLKCKQSNNVLMKDNPTKILIPLQMNLQSVPKKEHYSSNSGFVECCIVRDVERSRSLFQPRYNFYFQDIGAEKNNHRNSSTKVCVPNEHDALAMVAEKQLGNLTSNFHIYDMTTTWVKEEATGEVSSNDNNDDASATSLSSSLSLINSSIHKQHYIGKLRKMKKNKSNYVLYDSKKEKEQIAAFAYDMPSLWNRWVGGEVGHGQRRKLRVILPSIGKDGTVKPNPLYVKNCMIEETRKSGLCDLMTFHSRDPFLHCGEYTLDFLGRVSTPSVKNMQLVDESNQVVVQFGKVGHNRYHLDYRAPFNAFQAFALSLTALDFLH